MNPTPSDDAQALLGPWPGPYGGLPPYDRATPSAFEQAFAVAIEARRRAVRALADHPAPPDFENTVAALEDSGRPLRHLLALFRAVTTTATVGEWPVTARRLAPLAPALDTEIAHDPALFARIDAVWLQRHAAGLDAEQIRLVEVVRDRMLRAGAALAPPTKARLQAIDSRLAALALQFNQNLADEQAAGVVWLEAEADLAGLDAVQRQAAADGAAITELMDSAG